MSASPAAGPDEKFEAASTAVRTSSHACEIALARHSSRTYGKRAFKEVAMEHEMHYLGSPQSNVGANFKDLQSALRIVASGCDRRANEGNVVFRGADE
jgi:hypothetical protein